MLECMACGAIGEGNFSTNYFGELVCELCGTQSFLQNHTETQDAEDIGYDYHTVSKLKQTKRKSKRQRVDEKDKVKKDKDISPPLLLDCIVITQHVLAQQAQALVQQAQFPQEYEQVVSDLWFHLLEQWEIKSDRPLLRCFTQYHYRRRKEDRTMDPALISEELARWDAVKTQEQEEEEARDRLFCSQPESSSSIPTTSEIPPVSAPMPSLSSSPSRSRLQKCAVLDWFALPDLVALLLLATRVLNLGVIPSDLMRWIADGTIPYYNALKHCPESLQRPVDSVLMFFNSSIQANWISTAIIAFRAQYLQYHLELQLPPLNRSLVAYQLCHTLGFPSMVFRNFQWLTAQFNCIGPLPEQPLQQTTKASALTSTSGIAAYILCAIRLCPNWHEWIYERVEQHTTLSSPPYSKQDADCLLRRHLEQYIKLCEQMLMGSDRGVIPTEFANHVNDLEQLSRRTNVTNSTIPTASNGLHPLKAYPAVHEHGRCIETDEDIEKKYQQAKEEEDIKFKLNGSEHDAVYFYPVYIRSSSHEFHAPFQVVLEMVCEYIDAPMHGVIEWIRRLDQEMHTLCRRIVNEIETVERQDRRAELKGNLV